MFALSLFSQLSCITHQYLVFLPKHSKYNKINEIVLKKKLLLISKKGYKRARAKNITTRRKHHLTPRQSFATLPRADKGSTHKRQKKKRTAVLEPQPYIGGVGGGWGGLAPTPITLQFHLSDSDPIRNETGMGKVNPTLTSTIALPRFSCD